MLSQCIMVRHRLYPDKQPDIADKENHVLECPQCGASLTRRSDGLWACFGCNRFTVDYSMRPACPDCDHPIITYRPLNVGDDHIERVVAHPCGHVVERSEW